MKLEKKLSVFWFRRDLRISDNTGLFHALKSGNPVLCVFIFDTNILDQLDDRNDPRVTFIHNALVEINAKLISFGSTLATFHGNPLKVWKQILTDYSVGSVFTNHDYEPYAKERDEQIKTLLKKSGVEFITFKDQVIFEKDEVVKDDGKPYTVFTPYKNKWLKVVVDHPIQEYGTTKLSANFFKCDPSEIISLKEMKFKKSELSFPASEISVEMLKHYADNRNFPAIKGTSRISVHLRFGTVSIRKLAATAMKHHSDTWRNELIWRDYYHMILWNFPHVAQSSFKPAYDRIPWRNNEEEFQRWCAGTTGYPIVDAGMRELNTTGFMHNRVRMITASFLVKHLLIDWRWGEAYFAQKLLDFDLAANNGGWQWAAGSGCDAAPYFRIFNPYEQTRKFDPQFKYIRKWVPEFEDFSYPKPIVDHAFARNRCLTVYKSALR